MRIIFAGTPEVAIPALELLAKSEHEVVGVVTRPPARRGRGRTLIDSPVGARAKELGFKVVETNRPSDEDALLEIEALSPDLGVVVAYGALLAPKVLSIPLHGWINLHFSALPRWRGAAPVQHAILNGDQTIDTCVFQLEKGLDTGPIYSQETFVLNGTETAGTLLNELSISGAKQILEVVDSFDNGSATAVQQLEGSNHQNVTFAPRLSKEDGRVNFEQPAERVSAQVRAFSPNPGAWTILPDGKILKLASALVDNATDTPGVGVILAEKKRILVGCNLGCIELTKVAPAGKGWMDATAWWRGARLDSGIRLGKNK